MLNSTEHKCYHSTMLLNVKISRSFGFFNIYEHDKFNIWEFERKKSFFLGAF